MNKFYFYLVGGCTFLFCLSSCNNYRCATGETLPKGGIFSANFSTDTANQQPISTYYLSKNSNATVYLWFSQDGKAANGQLTVQLNGKSYLKISAVNGANTLDSNSNCHFNLQQPYCAINLQGLAAQENPTDFSTITLLNDSGTVLDTLNVKVGNWGEFLLNNKAINQDNAPIIYETQYSVKNPPELPLSFDFQTAIPELSGLKGLSFDLSAASLPSWSKNCQIGKTCSINFSRPGSYELQGKLQGAQNVAFQFTMAVKVGALLTTYQNGVNLFALGEKSILGKLANNYQEVLSMSQSNPESLYLIAANFSPDWVQTNGDLIQANYDWQNDSWSYQTKILGNQKAILLESYRFKNLDRLFYVTFDTSQNNFSLNYCANSLSNCKQLTSDSGPLTNYDVIAVDSTNGDFYAYDSLDYKILAYSQEGVYLKTFQLPNFTFTTEWLNSLLVNGGTIYAAVSYLDSNNDFQSNLLCYQNGNWADLKLQLQGEIISSMLQAAGQLYLGTDEGHLYSFDPKTNKKVLLATLPAKSVITDLIASPYDNFYLRVAAEGIGAVPKGVYVFNSNSQVVSDLSNYPYLESLAGNNHLLYWLPSKPDF